jgi:hypothetical protein
VAAPVTYLAFGLIGVALADTGDAVPTVLSGAAFIVLLLGTPTMLVLALVNLIRVIVSAARAPRRPRPAPSLHERLSSEDAERRGLTREEYGVYKGSVGSVVEPVNSAGGLLFISILLTVIAVGMLALIGFYIAAAAGLVARNPEDSDLAPVQWVFVALFFVAPFWSWHLYRVERRAQRLRIARGLPKTLR